VILNPEFTRNRLSAGLSQDPLAQLTALSQAPNWIGMRGPLRGWREKMKGKEEEGRKDGKKGKRKLDKE